MLIYCIKNKVNNKVYIGQTTSSLKRRYWGLSASWPKAVCSKHLKDSINKYGQQNFEFIEIEKCYSVEELNIKEQFYINLYDSTNPEKGYNYCSGGKNFKASERLIEINRQAQIKYWSNPESRKAQSDRKKKGICSTKEHQLKMALVQGAKPFDVFKKDTGEYVGTWINKAQCARDLNICEKCVRACYKNNKKSHKGYTFKVLGNA